MYKLGIDGRELERDMASVRRFLPAPIRSAALQLPIAIDRAAAVVRSWIDDHRSAQPPQGGAPRVKVILTQDVSPLGKSGDMKDVADGYASNYLIPRKLAVPAAGGAYRAWQHDIASREEKRKREREEAEIAAQRISSTTLTLGVKVGEGGKLYGSITAKDIADALGRRGIVIDRHKVDLDRAAQDPRHLQGGHPGLSRA